MVNNKFPVKCLEIWHLAEKCLWHMSDVISEHNNTRMPMYPRGIVHQQHLLCQCQLKLWISPHFCFFLQKAEIDRFPAICILYVKIGTKLTVQVSEKKHQEPNVQEKRVNSKPACLISYIPMHHVLTCQCPSNRFVRVCPCAWSPTFLCIMCLRASAQVIGL